MLTSISHFQSEPDCPFTNTTVSLRRAMESFSFIINMAVRQVLLQYQTPLSNGLQILSCDLVSASQQTSDIISLLDFKCSDSAVCGPWMKVCDLAGKLEVDCSMPVGSLSM